MRPPQFAFALAFLLLPSSFILAQGSLTPLGAPGATMKTLDQIDAKLETRTPISTAPFTINASGSYYLTGNLAFGTAGGSAITISADQVTVDLNGFSITSTASPASGVALLISGVRRNVTVRNGHIRGTTTFSAGAFTTGGFSSGVSNASTTSANLRVADLNILGMGSDGINLWTAVVPTFVVERCNVTVCGRFGIQASLVRDCSADTTGSTAILADVATNCSGETVNTVTAAAEGVDGVSNVENCRGISISGIGVSGANVSNSRGTSSTGTGLSATNVTNSSGTSTDGIGLSATDATNSLGSSENGDGLTATNASGSRGTSTTGTGLSALNAASSSYGGSTSGTGLRAMNATNSYGISSSAIGISASNATNCFGLSSTGLAAIDANPGTASFCRGQRTGGIAIDAGVAIGCTVATGTVNSLNKFLGTP